MPKNIHVEKEKLYEDTLHLKQNINNLKEENLKLKTKNLNLERENAKMVKAMEKMGSYTTQYGKQPESALVVALKKQVKDMKEELKIRIDELEVMKRSTKFTKVQELEIELKAYMDENIRLKSAFEELQRAKPEIKPEDYNMLEERYYMQANLIESLQRDHARLASDLKYMEEENYNFQLQRDTDAKNAQSQKAEINRLKKQIKDKEQKALQGYRGLGKTDAAKGEIDENEIRRIQEQKDQVIAQRDKTIEELRQKLNAKISTDTKDKQGQNSEVSKLKEQYAELESKYRALLNVHYPADERKKTNEGRPSSKLEDDNFSESRNLNDLKNKKLKRVTIQEVSSLGYELSLNLKIRHISLEDVLRSFDRHGQRISLADLKNIFSHDPFKVRDENNAILLARFIVEPQDEETIVFDQNRSQDLSIVKNVFKKLVGNYKLLDEDEEREIVEELGEIFTKYEESLQTQLMLIPEAKTGYLSSEQIAAAFDALDIEIEQKQFEFLIMNLYEYTSNLKRLDFMRMFELFETEEHKRMKKIIEMYQNQNDQDSERSDRKVKFKEEKTGFANRPQSAGHHNKQRNYKDEEDYEDEYAEEGDDNEYDEDYEEDEDHAKR